jgi:hypothetical protein
MEISLELYEDLQEVAKKKNAIVVTVFDPTGVMIKRATTRKQGLEII